MEQKMQSNHNIGVINQVLSDPAYEFRHIRLVGLFGFAFSTREPSVSLALSDNYLLIMETTRSLTPVLGCPLTFELKFEIIREMPWKDKYTPGRPIGIKFEKLLPNKSIETLQLYSQDIAMLYNWKAFLEEKLNQKNFHNLFKAKKQIGKGAFATVYLAERLEDKKLVAVKAFSKQQQFSGDQGKQSLINEITLIRKFKHPNIIHIQGVFETDNSIYVILQLLQGRQLYDRLKNNQLKCHRNIAQIIRNILSALKALAEKRVIHRDLKPENIMFRKQGSNDVVICDFGLATFAEEEKYLFVRCGTPGFVAPEIINIRDMSTKSDPISDVFSAGLIFHYLAFGRSIFQGKKYEEILRENRACVFNFEKDIYRNADKFTMDLLKRLLDVNPKTRITASEALNHPYFDFQRLEQKGFHRISIGSMIDEKEEEGSVQGRSRRMFLRDQTNILVMPKNPYRGSLYCQKDQERHSIVPRQTVCHQTETPARRSKRCPGNLPKVLFTQMRS